MLQYRLFIILKLQIKMNRAKPSQPDTQHHNNKDSITPILDYFFKPAQRSSGNQMLAAIKNDPHFNIICQNIAYLHENQLKTLDKDYITMKICSKISSDNANTKLQQAVDVLEELQMKMDCLIEELHDKNKWMREKSEEYKKNKENAQEDCEILTHQNAKLERQIENKEHEDHNKVLGNKSFIRGIDDKKQLQKLLQKFKCQQSGFPKNKNEAVRLLNNLQVIIQSLQVQKLSLS